VALSLVGGCADGGGDQQLTVFAAASLTDAFEEIAADFEAERAGVDVVLSFGASSSLREQILAGAPADVFASAAPGPMDELVSAGLVEDPRTFARNRLVIAVPPGNPGGVSSIDDLADPALLLGLCALEVPCGALAERVLADAGVAAKPDTEEADVRALLTKVVEGELDAGLVYVTDVTAAGRAVEAVDVPSDLRTEYPIAVVRGEDEADDERAELAQDFVDLVRGPQGRAVLDDAGFESP